MLRNGTLKPMAVAGDRRLAEFPNVGTVREFVPRYRALDYQVVLAPKGTPSSVLQRVNADVNKAMQEPDVVAKFREFVVYPTPGGVADTQRFLSQQKALFGGVIRDLGLKPE
jgi:tripartite-type tricarboxylate transporter receptor subunit TctC